MSNPLSIFGGGGPANQMGISPMGAGPPPPPPGANPPIFGSAPNKGSGSQAPFGSFLGALVPSKIGQKTLLGS